MEKESIRPAGSRRTPDAKDIHDHLEEAVPVFQSILQQRFSKPSFFLMACDPADAAVENRYGLIKEALGTLTHRDEPVPLLELELTPREAGMEQGDAFPAGAVVRCLALDLGASERMRSVLKEALWKIDVHRGGGERSAGKSRSARDRLRSLAANLDDGSRPESGRDRPAARDLFALRTYGLFVPAAVRSPKEIRTHTFDHSGGLFYRYRVVTEKTKAIPPRLADYLESLFTDCPNHFFTGDPRISGMRWLPAPACEVAENHGMSRLAKAALKEPRYRSPHDRVEMFLLEKDPDTVACEIPVWLEPGELGGYSSLFSPTKALTGHIDILRQEEGKIGIWDYKSDTIECRHGGLQVFLYAVALSIRTGIPLANFTCGVFDRNRALVFAPADPLIF